MCPGFKPQCPVFSVNRRITNFLTASSPRHHPCHMRSSRGRIPHQYARTACSPSGHKRFSPVVLPARCVHRQRVSALHPHIPLYMFSSSPRGTGRASTRHYGLTGVSPSSPYLHRDECGGGRPKPLNTEWTLPLESLQTILR